MEALIDIVGSKALDNLLSLGLLFVAVWWFMKRDTKKDEVILALHNEQKTLLREETAKTREAINNNTIALNAIVDSKK